VARSETGDVLINLESQRLIVIRSKFGFVQSFVRNWAW